MIKDLVKLADNFDKSGLKKEADYIDRLIKKIAQEAPSLADALRLACEKFVQNTPDPKNYKGNIVELSGRSRKSNVELGDVYGNVAFYISGHREYPLLSSPDGSVASPSFRSEDEIMKTLINSTREAFSELGMSQRFNSIKFKSPVKVKLSSGLSGFRVETNIPFKEKPSSVLDTFLGNRKITKELYERPKYHIVEDGETMPEIARRYGLNERDIMIANGLHYLSSQNLEPGTSLLIPKIEDAEKFPVDISSEGEESNLGDMGSWAEGRDL